MCIIVDSVAGNGGTKSNFVKDKEVLAKLFKELEPGRLIIMIL